MATDLLSNENIAPDVVAEMRAEARTGKPFRTRYRRIDIYRTPNWLEKECVGIQESGFFASALGQT
jgi:hypothetical protein